MAFAALALAAAPARAQPDAQESAIVQDDRQLTEGGRWLAKLAEAITVGSEGSRELNQGMQALVAKPLNRERIAAALPGVRAQIERSRADVRRSNAILDSLPPLSPEVAEGIEPEQQIRDLRAHNARLMGLLDAFDAFLVALGKGDDAGMQRSLPAIMDGSLAMLSQQRLLIRTRQASAPKTDSTHQSLGVAGQLYRTMEGMHRHALTARQGSEAEGAKAAAVLRDELRLVAQETRALALAGRKNLEREIAEIDEEARGGDAAEARFMDRIRRVYTAEAKVFVLADRLVAFAEANGAITAAQLRPFGAASPLAPLRVLEEQFIAITVEQAEALAAGE